MMKLTVLAKLTSPHLASVAIPSSSAEQIAANILRVSAGELPHNIIEPSRGY